MFTNMAFLLVCIVHLTSPINPVFFSTFDENELARRLFWPPHNKDVCKIYRFYVEHYLLCTQTPL